MDCRLNLRIMASSASMSIGSMASRALEASLEFDVINVGRLAGDEARVLAPFDRLLNQGGTAHKCTYPSFKKGEQNP